MKRLPYLVAFGLALVRLHAEIPEAYRVLVQRNVFDPHRGPVVSRAPTEQRSVPPPIPTESTTLVGVAILNDAAAALFAGTRAGLAGTRRPGDDMEIGRLEAVTTDGVTVTARDGSTLRLDVGQTLSRRVGEAWRLTDGTHAPPSAASFPGPGTSPAGVSPTTSGTPAADTRGPAAAPAAAPSSTESAAGADEILKRMLERRKRELSP
ncbi:MAG: hypothetical protein JXR77_01755 [Lentisphaeria bacterium]|nr:hypothetical protein [Lentisphaeria bacterium]